jgi:lambda repressor-like predicted transcriptional regulator
MDIKKKLKDHGYNMNWLSVKMQISYQLLNAYINGRVRVNAEMDERLKKELNGL